MRAASPSLPLAERAAPSGEAPQASLNFLNFSRAIRFPGLACLLLGALAALGFAPLEAWPLALLAVAGWLALVHEAGSLRRALWRGWLFGLGHFTINDNWIAHAFDFQQAMPPALGLAAPVLLALYLAVYPMLAAGLAWRLAARPGQAPDGAYVLIAGAAWITAEWLRATMFTGYAWDPLGVIWVPVEPVAGLAAWVGTYALSGLSVVLAGALLLAVRRGRWGVAGTIATLLVLAGLQFVSYLPQTPSNFEGTPRFVRIVQPNIGQDQRGDTDAELMLRALLPLSGRPGGAPRLVLWPEGVVRDYLEDGYPWPYYMATEADGYDHYHSPALIRRRLASVLGPRDVLLAGGASLEFTRDEQIRDATNAIYALASGGRLVARYDKAHLVPYGEYLPMRPLLSAIGLSRLVPGDIDFRPGPGPRTIDLPGFGAVGMQICYEIVFSGQVVDEAHRPTLIFNPSNDAWFGSWGPPQHLAQARMRAIEEGLPILRATPTGISAAIDAHGRVLAAVPLGTRGAVELAMPRPLPPTLFARVGNPMAALLVVLLVAGGIALRRRARYGII